MAIVMKKIFKKFCFLLCCFSLYNSFFIIFLAISADVESIMSEKCAISW